MVRVSPIIAVLATGSSIVHALPTVQNEKRAQDTPKYQLVKYNADGTQAMSDLNLSAAMAGAGMLGMLGAMIGGMIGAYMPANTTLSIDSIMKGLESEASSLTAYVNTLSNGGGLSGLIPGLAGQPSLSPGSAPAMAPEIATPPPVVPTSTNGTSYAPSNQSQRGPTATTAPVPAKPAAPVPAKPSAPAMPPMAGMSHGGRR